MQLITDQSGNNHPAQLIGTATLATSPLSGFGNALSTDGVNNASTTAGAACAPGTYPVFTGGAGSLEFTLKRSRTGVQEKFIGQFGALGTLSDSNWEFYCVTNGTFGYVFYDSGGTNRNVNGGSTVLDTNAHQIEVSWDGTTLRLFLDGIIIGTLAFASTFNNLSLPLFMGRVSGSTTDAFSGLIDEVRISNIARHTTNYTPATTPFTNDANTKLLLHFDSATTVTGTFTRPQSTPVIAKGSTYDGWTADALASPTACWDGTRWVMTVGAWSIANAKWASLFFASTNFKTWTYVTGSLRAPTGSDYILGNSGIAYWKGKYWFAYNHYSNTVGSPPVGTASGINIDWSIDLTHWTNTVSLGIDASGADVSLIVNPTTNNLECWFLDSSRYVEYSFSTDGSTWTPSGHGALIVSSDQIPYTTDFGEPSIYYVNGLRYATCDGGIIPGGRSVQFYGSGLVYQAPALVPSTTNAWESANVFDGTIVGAYDIGDGNGRQLWLIYAGSDIYAPTDNTDSSIGIAYATAPALSGPGGFYPNNYFAAHYFAPVYWPPTPPPSIPGAVNAVHFGGAYGPAMVFASAVLGLPQLASHSQAAAPISNVATWSAHPNVVHEASSSSAAGFMQSPFAVGSIQAATMSYAALVVSQIYTAHPAGT